MVSEILISTASERSEAETCCAVDVEYYRKKTQVYKTLFSCCSHQFIVESLRITQRLLPSVAF